MIKFLATLKDSGHPIKIDSDGQAEIVFAVPAQELAAALPLAAMGKKVLIVGVKAESDVAEMSIEEWLTQ